MKRIVTVITISSFLAIFPLFLSAAGGDEIAQKTFPKDKCPMTVDGAQVEFQQVNEGGALDFTTTKRDSTQELQKRVRYMADMYNRDEFGYTQEGHIMHRMSKTDKSHKKMHQSGESDYGSERKHSADERYEETREYDQAKKDDGYKDYKHAKKSDRSMDDNTKKWNKEHHMMTDVTAEVENTENGARLILTTENGNNADKLQSHVKWLAENMTSNECPELREVMETQVAVK